MQRELYGLKVSPWTEKARWALDHHGLDYDFHEYRVVLSEPGLRLRIGRLRGKLTVPVLITPHGALGDSLDIVRFADRVGAGEPLVPEPHEAEILAWHERAERALTAGRSLYTRRLLDDPEALSENVPEAIPRALRVAFAKSGMPLFRRKYGLQLRSEEQDERELSDALDALRAALHGEHLVGGSFTLADLCMALALHPVRPAADRFFPLSAASRRCWTHAALAERYADLLGWRDRIVEAHRRRA